MLVYNFGKCLDKNTLLTLFCPKGHRILFFLGAKYVFYQVFVWFWTTKKCLLHIRQAKQEPMLQPTHSRQKLKQIVKYCWLFRILISLYHVISKFTPD